MNKADLIEAVAREANFTHVDTKRAIDATISVIQKALKRGDTVGLVGFVHSPSATSCSHGNQPTAHTRG